MKVSIAVEITDDRPQFEIVAPPPARHEPQRPVARASANFVAQLLATFYQESDGRPRAPAESHGAIECYENASAPLPPASGIIIRRKI